MDTTLDQYAALVQVSTSLDMSLEKFNKNLYTYYFYLKVIEVDGACIKAFKRYRSLNN